jgi:serine/threonine protein kinase/tetratricopeptide (TPR) repeat protein
MNIRAEDWARIRGVLDGALGLAPADRARYLDSVCAGDHQLRRQVDTLLASHHQAQTFLENPASLLIDDHADVPDDISGRRIGSYAVERRIGVGGMGEVYLAHDTNLNRRVALKLMSVRFSLEEDRLRRFRQEALAVSALNHPNILVIHDFGECDGRPFMVTEFVAGQTLRQRMRGVALPLHEAVSIGLQVANALAAAHAGGIVHRDVKPENVMVRPDGYVKVLDFGLAKLADARTAADDPNVLRTTPGMVMGTPRYMSPEQARGHDLDTRSDIWSFGAMLYEMVSGEPPFSGATPADLIAAILNVEPVPLELKVPAVSPALGRLVARSLRKSRLDRHATAAVLVTELTTVHKQLDSDPPATPASASRHDTDSPNTASSSRGGIAKRTRLVVLPFRLLRPDAETDFLAFSLADAIATTLSNLDSLIVRSTLTAARLATAELDLRTLADEAEIDTVLVGTLLRTGPQLRVSAQLLAAPDGTIIWSDRIDVPAHDLIRIQDELTERIVDSLSLPLASRDHQVLRRDAPASAKAYELYLRGNSHFYDSENWTIARDLFIECVTEDPHYAPAWARLGRCYRLTAKFRSASVDEMTENLKRADVAFRKAFEINPDLPIAHHLYTALETDLGRADEAMLRLVRRARQRRGDPELYAGLVHACRYCGLLDASVAAHQHARRIDPQIATSVGQTYWMRGEFERAIDGFSTLGFFVGLPFVSLGRDADALRAAEQAAEIVRDPTTRSYQKILPLLLTGKTDECRALLDRLAPHNPDPESVYYIARTYARLGAADAALKQFTRAVDSGFFCAPAFELDSWLDPLRPHPSFGEALARAKVRHADAARKFCDAGGERLLGLASS